MNLASLLTTTAGLAAGSPAMQGVNAGVNAGGEGGDPASTLAFADLLGPLLQAGLEQGGGNAGGKDAAEGGKDLPVLPGLPLPDAAALAALPDAPVPVAITAALALPDAAPGMDVLVPADRGNQAAPSLPQPTSGKPALAPEMPAAPTVLASANPAPASLSQTPAAPLTMQFARTDIQMNLRADASSASAAQSAGAAVTGAPIAGAEVAADLLPEQALARPSAIQAIAARLAERAAPPAAPAQPNTMSAEGPEDAATLQQAALAAAPLAKVRGTAVADVADKPAAAPASSGNSSLPAPAPAPAPAPSTMAFADGPRMAAPEGGNTQPVATSATPGHDFEAVIEKLAQARELAQPGRASLQLAHREFGQVAVQFDMMGQSLKVALSSSDAGFAPAVQAALAERPVIAVQDGAAARNDGRGDGRGDARADQAGYNSGNSGPSAQSDQQRGEQQARSARNPATGEPILRQTDQTSTGEASPRAPRDGSRFA